MDMNEYTVQLQGMTHNTFVGGGNEFKEDFLNKNHSPTCIFFTHNQNCFLRYFQNVALYTKSLFARK